MSTSLELRSQWDGLVKQAEAMQATAEKNNTFLTDEESLKFDDLMSQANETKLKIANAERKEKLQLVNAELSSSRPRTFEAPAIVQHRSGSKKNFTEKDYKKGFEAWLLGEKRANGDQLFMADELGIEIRSKVFPVDKFNLSKDEIETRSLTSTGSTTGLYLTPIDMSKQVDIAQKYYFPVYDAMGNFSTENTTAYNWPQFDSTQLVATTQSESGSPGGDFSGYGTAATDPTIANTGGVSQSTGSFKAVRYTSGVYAISQEEIISSVVPIVDLMAEALGISVNRKKEADGINANSSSNGYGYATNATASGLQLGSTNLPTEDIIIQLVHSLDLAYRDAPGCGFIMSDGMWEACERITDQVGRKIFANFLDPTAAIGQKPRIGRFPVWISNQMPTPTSAGSNVPLMIFGDLQKQKWRNVTGANGVGGRGFFRYEEVLRWGGVSGVPGGSLGVEWYEWGYTNNTHYQTNVPAFVSLNSHT